MPTVDVKVTEGALTVKQKNAIKEAIKKGVNEVYLDILGPYAQPRTWVLVEDTEDG